MQTLQTGRKERGLREAFTLIELTVVLFMMVLAAALVAPRFPGFLQSIQLKDAARRVAGLVQLGREQAILEEQTISLIYDANSHRFRLIREDLQNSSPGTSPNQGETGEVPLSGVQIPLPEKVTVSLEKVGDSSANTSDTLVFEPDGRAEDANILLEIPGQSSLAVAIRRNATRIRIVPGEEALNIE